MEPLRIHCFGPLDIAWGGRRSIPFPTQKARSLLAFLVLYRDRLVPREVLIGVFWGERPEQVARKSLRTELWRLRGLIEPDGVPPGTYLVLEGGAVGFNRGAPCWLDLEEFERCLDASGDAARPHLTPASANSLQAAVHLYRGDLLDGVYDDWCLYERERFKALFRLALERLMGYHAAHCEWAEAIARGQQLLSRDPLLEHVHRELMRFHYALGDRPAALRQYETCAALLRRELGIDPMAETVRLCEAIRTGRRHRAETPAPGWAELRALEPGGAERPGNAPESTAPGLEDR